MKKLVIVTTVPLSLATLVRGQPKYLSKYFDITLISSNGELIKRVKENEGVRVITIDMSRKITPFADLKSLLKLFITFKKIKPDIVYSFTPKAGLLSMMASYFAGVKVRVHNIVGMPLMEAKGIKREILKLIEKITYSFATNLFCNSYGLREYIRDNLTKREIEVIYNGSINGVDTNYFRDNFSKEEKKKIKERLGVKESDFVLLFVGRVVRDKGVNELIEAFDILNRKFKNLKLLIVGDYEEHLNPLYKKTLQIMRENRNIIQVGFQKDIREYLAISDIFILPSYREGLPNSLLEAGSFGVPLVASNINGCNEIVVDGENGLLIEPKSVEDIVKKITTLIEDRKLYNKLKSNIRNSIIKRYNQSDFLVNLKERLENLS
jgi:glycosyltransferase involved in cell wall biosynthesis